MLKCTSIVLYSMNTTQKIDARKSPMSAFLQKQGVDFEAKEHKSYKLTASGFMDLTVETWQENNLLNVSVCHYGEQNGDLMRDPEMVFVFGYGYEKPIYFRNDYTGTEQQAQIVRDGQTLVNPRLIKELARFAKIWVSNLKAQGHKMEVSS